MRVILLAILVFASGCVSPGGAELSNWPNGYRSAAAITFDVQTVEQEHLTDLMDALKSRSMNATFFVVAGYIQEKPGLLTVLRDYEVASLGWYHADWKAAELTEEFQRAEIGRAHEWLSGARFRVRGFRAPYLKSNKETLDILEELGYAYDSTSYYGFLPYRVGNIVEIPLSVNYDLYWDERSVRAATMPTFLSFKKSLDEGGLFVFYSHINRIQPHFEDFTALLDFVRRDDVWVATCGEIADWWRIRENLQISTSGNAITVWNKGNTIAKGVTITAPDSRKIQGALLTKSTAGRTYAVLPDIQPGGSVNIAVK